VYRDSRASVEGRIKSLESELDTADEELEARESELAPLAVQLFPLFHNFDDTVEPITGGAAQRTWATAVVMGCLGLMSIPALPFAIAWRQFRPDVRALRKARAKSRAVRDKLLEARQTLLQLEAGDATEPE